MTDPKLIERVLKLFALAAGTTFAAEADSARRMAEQLIAKHNITLPSTKDRTAFARTTYVPYFKGAQWEFILAKAVAKACGCYTLFYGQDALTAFELVGAVADLEACEYLLAVLHEQRMRDWMRAKREGVGDSFYRFCFSWARGVESNLERQSPEDALSRREHAKLWYEGEYGKAEPYDLNIRGQGRSEAGRAAGEGASLHRGNLGAGAPVKRLGSR